MIKFLSMNRQRVLAFLLYLQALSLFGFFTLHHGPHFFTRIENDFHSAITSTSEAASILISGTLFMTARSLRLRRRQAWVLAISLQSFLILIFIFRIIHFNYIHHRGLFHFRLNGRGIASLVSEFIILFLLIFWRSTFKTIAGPQTFSRVGRMTIRTIGSSLLLGFIIVFFDHHIFITAPNFIEALRITIKGFFGISDSYNYASVRTRERTEILLGGLGLVSIATICWQFFKPFERKVHLDPIDEQMIRHLLDNESDVDSLSYFALRDNKTIIWSRNKKAAIPYSVINGVMITTGDPVGDRESWPDAMERFINEAEIHAWIPCIYGCSQTAGEIWVKETGFSALEIGDEAIVEVDDFSLEGSAMKNVRQMVTRVRRVGITSYTKWSGDLTVHERTKFAKLANEWRRGGPERGFSMALGRFCDERDPNLIISWSEQNGEPIALLQFVPWGSNGLSLDIMRRSENSENGVNEELIVSTIEWAKRNNINKISLNFATFRSIFARGSQLGAGPITKLNYRALKFLSRFAQMESLYRFNAKFRPIWEPRFVVYPGASNLLRVTIAILKIESFLPKIGSSRK